MMTVCGYDLWQSKKSCYILYYLLVISSEFFKEFDEIYILEIEWLKTEIKSRRMAVILSTEKKIEKLKTEEFFRDLPV